VLRGLGEEVSDVRGGEVRTERVDVGVDLVEVGHARVGGVAERPELKAAGLSAHRGGEGAEGGSELGLVTGDGPNHCDHRPFARGQVIGHPRHELAVRSGRAHGTVTGVPGSTIRLATCGATRASASV
jgi:hypothetical protein